MRVFWSRKHKKKLVKNGKKTRDDTTTTTVKNNKPLNIDCIFSATVMAVI